jgi:acetate kinase
MMAVKHFNRILTINSGSSSIKFSLYHMGRTERLVLSGSIGGIGFGSGIFHVKAADGRTVVERHLQPQNHGAALKEIIEWLQSSPTVNDLEAMGHRLVHGGNRFSRPHLVTPDLLETLDKLMPLAPDHLPHEINAVKVFKDCYPGVKQVACFDTAFHRNMPQVA